MNCPSCGKEVVADKLICTWCDSFIPDPKAGKKAGLVRRWFATAIDPALAILLYFIIAATLGGGAGAAFGESAGFAAITIVTIAYGIFYLWLLSRGVTPGKLLLGERVVEKLGGGNPGLGRMFLREVVGKFVSSLFLGLGFFWAIWDKDSQAWHDKIAGTVVLRKG
ncbi:MAG: RDD family protein [Acidobacteriota bacterium]